MLSILNTSKPMAPQMHSRGGFAPNVLESDEALQVGKLVNNLKKKCPRGCYSSHVLGSGFFFLAGKPLGEGTWLVSRLIIEITRVLRYMASGASSKPLLLSKCCLKSLQRVTDVELG